MRIRVLYFEGCPNHPLALELVRRVVADLGVDADIEAVEIRGPGEVKDLRFLGSPTIQVDGHDIEPGAENRTEYAMCCRMYGPSGVPPRGMIEAAIRNGSVG